MRAACSAGVAPGTGRLFIAVFEVDRGALGAGRGRGLGHRSADHAGHPDLGGVLAVVELAHEEVEDGRSAEDEGEDKGADEGGGDGGPEADDARGGLPASVLCATL